MSKADGEKLKRKQYEKELDKLQVELCYLQDWVKTTGERIIIVLEGRDAAGKGGLIKAMTARVSPRVFRVVALPAHLLDAYTQPPARPHPDLHSAGKPLGRQRQIDHRIPGATKRASRAPRHILRYWTPTHTDT